MNLGMMFPLRSHVATTLPAASQNVQRSATEEERRSRLE